MVSNCPPEFILYRLHPTNDFRWVVEIIDPPSQGVYETESFDAATDRKILTEMTKKSHFL